MEEDDLDQCLIDINKTQQKPMKGSWLLQYWKDNIVVEFFPRNKEEQDEE